METLITTIIAQFGREIWIGSVSLILTGFIMLALKEFISDLLNYFKIRMGDIGFGQTIYWKDELFTVKEIKFRYLLIYDDEKIVRIPLRVFLKGPIVFRNPYKNNDSSAS